MHLFQNLNSGKKIDWQKHTCTLVSYYYLKLNYTSIKEQLKVESEVGIECQKSIQTRIVTIATKVKR